MMVMRKLITAEAYAVMIERSSSRQGFLYRRGGNLLFFGVQFIVVLGIVLIVVNSGDDKPRLPKFSRRGFR
jgi:hypothetical protein